ncbi:alpha/beta fold hydrolase [Brumimicrobium aurantiacum]|uniref:Alpha/beta hydrolase n=1 Tax=Brumimicrobium aurantiacum TaxID=1737063 RepID=A0A3E1EXN6_9FLAO|nr:alpha/beta hydrolase [Brumimicrobium aurantiacum]RFC54319.1 alpha/beta hydrolase [Brumimicrobium aurantiacum]
MKFFYLLVFLCFSSIGFSQEIKTVYFLPGQGSDARIFDSLKLDTNYTIRHLRYDTLTSKMNMKELAEKLAVNIDTTEGFALVGVSLGGMLCVELSEMLNPEKVVIISSAKNRKELPVRYRFQKAIPLYAVFPSRLIAWGAKTLQPIVEPDRDQNEATFKSMLEKKNEQYLKYSVRMIIRWERKANTSNLIHIHGSNDHTIPIRNIDSTDFVIENGSHMMALTKGEEIGGILNRILNMH